LLAVVAVVAVTPVWVAAVQVVIFIKLLLVDY
jgi:hypothetical protein